MDISGWLSFTSSCFLAVWLCATRGQCQLSVHGTVRLVLDQDGRCYQFASMLSHPSDTCHQCYFHRHSIAGFSPLRCAFLLRLIRLTARRLSTPPHLSLRGQGCRQITSLAFHLCHVGLLPLWQLAAVFSRKRKRKEKKSSTGLRGAGWEHNRSWQCATHWTVILMAAMGMYGAEVTHKRPVCVGSCWAGK